MLVRDSKARLVALRVLVGRKYEQKWMKTEIRSVILSWELDSLIVFRLNRGRLKAKSLWGTWCHGQEGDAGPWLKLRSWEKKTWWGWEVGGQNRQASPVRDDEGDKGGALKGLKEEGLHIGHLGSVGEPGLPSPTSHCIYRGQTGLRNCPDCFMVSVSPIILSVTLCAVILCPFACLRCINPLLASSRQGWAPLYAHGLHIVGT